MGTADLEKLILRRHVRVSSEEAFDAWTVRSRMKCLLPTFEVGVGKIENVHKRAVEKQSDGQLITRRTLLTTAAVGIGTAMTKGTVVQAYRRGTSSSRRYGDDLALRVELGERRGPFRSDAGTHGGHRLQNVERR